MVNASPIKVTLYNLIRKHHINTSVIFGASKVCNIRASRCYHNGEQYDNHRDSTYRKRYGYLTIAASTLIGLSSALGYKKLQALNRDGSKENQRDSKLRIISRQEVKKHDSVDQGVWITYKGNVYDITDFIAHHPGGSQTIMMGAGGDVGPFWQTYTVHEAHEVQKLLTQYKIGVLPTEEWMAEQQEEQRNTQDEGPYSNDPERSRLLNVLTEQPFNAETPAKMLTPTFHTPVDIFFVRNHLPVPEVDLNDYSLTISVGSDGKPDDQKIVAQFTLDQLKNKFKAHTIDCVIQCSGNRRSELKKIKEIKGLNWDVGAMSNARWTGVKLTDVIESLNINLGEDKIKHIQMEGLDCDMTGKPYGSSISADVALDPKKDVLLAYEMNGEPLTRDHGFPLRFVAPGITGARNVKWLSRIILSDEESTSHWQRNDYKSFSPNVDMFNLNYKESISIQEMPVQSAICNPIDGELLVVNPRELQGDKLKIPVKGYAYSGGGKMIVRVDVSVDGGKTWLTANLLDSPRNSDNTFDYSKRNQVWSWTRWSLDLEVEKDLIEAKDGNFELLCRAFDSAYNSQPERAETIWNVRGVVNNSWHRIGFKVKLNSS